MVDTVDKGDFLKVRCELGRTATKHYEREINRWERMRTIQMDMIYELGGLENLSNWKNLNNWKNLSTHRTYRYWTVRALQHLITIDCEQCHPKLFFVICHNSPYSRPRSKNTPYSFHTMLYNNCLAVAIVSRHGASHGYFGSETNTMPDDCTLLYTEILRRCE